MIRWNGCGGDRRGRERADLTYYCTSHRSSRRLSDFDQWSVNELEFTFRWSINHQFSDWKYVQLGSCVYKYVGDRVLDWIGYDRRQRYSVCLINLLRTIHVCLLILIPLDVRPNNIAPTSLSLYVQTTLMLDRLGCWWMDGA